MAFFVTPSASPIARVVNPSSQSAWSLEMRSCVHSMVAPPRLMPARCGRNEEGPGTEIRETTR